METVLEIIHGDVYIESAVMDIAMLVRKCGKENDIINFARKGVYIHTSDEEGILEYMQGAKNLFDFTIGGIVSTKKEHGLNLIFKYNHVALPTMIMKVRRISDGSMFKNVEFDVTVIDDNLTFVRCDFGASFVEGVLK